MYTHRSGSSPVQDQRQFSSASNDESREARRSESETGQTEAATPAPSTASHAKKYPLTPDQKSLLEDFVGSKDSAFDRPGAKSKKIPLVCKSKKIDPLPLSLNLRKFIAELANSEEFGATVFLGGSRRDQVLGYAQKANDTDLYAKCKRLQEPSEEEVAQMERKAYERAEKNWPNHFRNTTIEAMMENPNPKDVEEAKA